MALKFGSTTISSSYTPKFNSTALKSIKYGSTEVWKNETVFLNGSSLMSGYALKKKADGTGMTAEISSSGLYISKWQPGSYARWGSAYFSPKISGYTTLNCSVSSITAMSNNIKFGLATSIGSNDYDSATSFSVSKDVKSAGTYSVNISGKSGYICFEAHTWDGTTGCYISKIWLT